ncbi:MAG: hypothetical protein V4714_20960 [Bacteroidota bacterium]
MIYLIRQHKKTISSEAEYWKRVVGQQVIQEEIEAISLAFGENRALLKEVYGNG